MRRASALLLLATATCQDPASLVPKRTCIAGHHPGVDDWCVVDETNVWIDGIVDEWPAIPIQMVGIVCSGDPCDPATTLEAQVAHNPQGWIGVRVVAPTTFRGADLRYAVRLRGLPELANETDYVIDASTPQLERNFIGVTLAEGDGNPAAFASTAIGFEMAVVDTWLPPGGVVEVEVLVGRGTAGAFEIVAASTPLRMCFLGGAIPGWVDPCSVATP